MTYFPHLFTKYLIHSSNTMEIISMYNLQVLNSSFYYYSISGWIRKIT